MNKQASVIILLTILVIVELGAAAVGETMVNGGISLCQASRPGAYLFGIIGLPLVIGGFSILWAETIMVVVFGLYVVARLVRRLRLDT